jgi:AcrR family transcriptional regulator
MDSIQTTKSESRRGRRKDARPSELTAAALDLFVEKGFAATRLEDVAARAGVSKGTLYLYFDSKEALFKAVIQSAVIPAVERGEQLVDQFVGTASDLVREIVRAWWRLFAGTKLGGIPKLMISEARNFPEIAQYYHDNVIVRGKRLFARTIQRGIDTGEFRPIDVDFAVQVLLGPLIMLAIWEHSFASCAAPYLDPERYLEVCADLFLDGLRAQR